MVNVTRQYLLTASLCCAIVFWPAAVIAAASSGVKAEVPQLPAESDSDELTAEFLEQNHSVIGVVTVNNQNVFDIDDPEEDKWLYRMANAIHITTRPGVVESQLLFEPGSEFSAQQIEETERLLRVNRYLGDADIEYVNYEDGVVDLNVLTKDVWTLKAEASFGRSGGVNTGGFGLEEHNLFGTGALLAANYKSTEERDIASIEFKNSHFRGSDYSLAALYSNNSDGYDRGLAYFKPFISLDSRRAGGMTLRSGERIDTLYDQGDAQAEFTNSSSYYEAFRGWSKGLNNGWTRRVTAGLTYDSHDFSAVRDSDLTMAVMPEDRKFIYPFIGLEVIEDKFETARNFDQINRTEDRYLGTRYSARLGYSPANDVSTRGSALYQAELQSGMKLGKAETLLAGATLSGRMDGGEFGNTVLSAFTTYHKRQSEKRLFFANLTATVGDNLDLDNPISLGGATGLRGYPLHYQSGTSSAVLTVEQRIFTDWYPFRLFNIGGAVFFDAGRTWGESPTGGVNHGWLRDVGFGLRIANTRSSIGRVMHLDVAYPLDGDSDLKSVQFLLQAKRSF